MREPVLQPLILTCYVSRGPVRVTARARLLCGGVPSAWCGVTFGKELGEDIRLLGRGEFEDPGLRRPGEGGGIFAG